jgi:hypothetical protein
MRSSIIVVIVGLFGGLLTAQERIPDTSEKPLFPAQHTQPDFLFEQRQQIFLPGFREYMQAQESEEFDFVRTCTEMLAVDLADPEYAHPKAIEEYLLIRYNFGLQLRSGSSGGTIWQYLGQLLLRESMQFAYTFAREKVRESSLTEMDYLYLPQGPGVLRSFDEASTEALVRGELQAYRIWYDLYHELKNKPPCPGNTTSP